MENSTDDESSKEPRCGNKCKKAFLGNLTLKLKFMLFVICITGFTYHVSQFLKVYYNYPTVRDVKADVNKEYTIPAITYCYIKSATRNNYCETNTQHCRNASESDCGLYPDYCSNNYKVPIEENLKNLKKGSLEDFKDLNVKISDIMTCNPWNISKDDVIGPYFSLSWYSFNVSVCFSMNTRVNDSKDTLKWKNDNPRRESYDHEKYFTGTIKFDLKEMIEIEPNITHSVAIMAHSPFLFSQPEKKKVLFPYNRYELLIGMEDKKRLPYPYSEDCKDYIAEWEKNGRQGPRSQKVIWIFLTVLCGKSQCRACRDICEIQYDLSCFGCVNARKLYPGDERQCVKGFDLDQDDKCSKEDTEKYHTCVSDCLLECSKTTYDNTITEKEKDPWDTRGYQKGVIDVDVYVKTQTIVYTYRPQFQFVELFSNIGGYMGIWLGLSLFTLAGISRSILNYLKPFLRKCGARIKQKP